MKTKIKFNIFGFLYNIFAFLADKTNGWKMFVKPKLLFGALVVGMGVNSCRTQVPKLPAVTCYKPAPLEYREYREYRAKINQIDSTTFTNDTVHYIGSVEIKPQFPGGEGKMMKFISKNLIWPAPEICAQGRVTCIFIIEKDGSISNIEIIKGFEGLPAFNAEAVRVISLMPKWKPAQKNGQIVRCTYTLPIVFKLQ
jgi:TonB family protein